MPHKLDERHAERKLAAAFIVSIFVALVSTSCRTTPDEPQKTTGEQTRGSAAPKEPSGTTAQPVTTGAAQKEPKKRTDRQIANAIDDTFVTDVALHNKQIDVAVNLGIATLTGRVDNLMAKERAAKLAQTIRGVRAVVNSLELKTSSRSGNDIRKDVTSALLYDAATDSYQIKPEVKDGVVTLSGTLPSYRVRELAVAVAKGVKGVKAVNDNITLNGASKRSDTEIAAEVRRAINIDVWLHSSYVSTDVKDGVVTLTGMVGSPSQYDRANLLAWTAGVKSVHAEGLKTEPWAKASSQRPETVAVKGDQQIEQAVHDSLFYDPRVFSFNPRVEVENGVVTLTGMVDNLKAKRAAEQDAKNTWGVWRVKNLLKTRPVIAIADDKLEQNVISAFLRDPIMYNFRISVKSKDGVVMLNGTVDSNYEKAQAEDIASRANGVVDVDNNLTVNNPFLVYHDLDYDPYWGYLPSYTYWSMYHAPYAPIWPYAGDALVQDEIENKIFWNPWLALDDITIKVVNGAASLTGYADGWFDIIKATQYAYDGGAQQVYNNIAIR
jgi:osmotically-inducible protein OsmY